MLLAEHVVVDSWAAAVTATAVTLGYIALIFLQILSRRQIAQASLRGRRVSKRAERAADKAAEEARGVGTKVDENTQLTRAVAHTVEIVHALNNSERHAVLALVLKLTRRVAAYSGLPEDAQAVTEAERALVEHDARQAVADQGQSTDPRLREIQALKHLLAEMAQGEVLRRKIAEEGGKP